MRTGKNRPLPGVVSQKGAYKHHLFYVWHEMIARCFRPSRRNYPRYGGRGIKVCERWLTFENFIIDLPTRPSAEHSLERIDGSADYEPGNVIWATATIQARNRRSNHLISLKGKIVTLIEAVELTDIKYNTVLERLRRGWSAEAALQLTGAVDVGAEMRHEKRV